jgi:hypothetical protein
MEAGTVPDKVTISHRGARYEIGRGKRYYGIWVVDAPASDPIDRWPETREGWAQAWTRFVSIETPQSITAVEQPRSGFKFPGIRRPSKDAAAPGDATDAAEPAARPARVSGPVIAAALLAIGVVIGIVGLFPDYFTGQRLASQAEQLVPHLFYLAGWAVSSFLILRGARVDRQRVGVPGSMMRVGALLGTGLSAVTLGLFVSDIGQVTSGESGVEAGLIISLVGWFVCVVGSVLALAIRNESRSVDLAGAPIGGAPIGGAAYGGAPYGGAPYGGAPYGGAPYGGAPSGGAPYGGAPSGVRPAVYGRPVRPRLEHAGPIALLVLGALGTVAAFVPSWDSYTLLSSAGTQTITAGNAFSEPGVVITGTVLVMIAVVAVAVVAALWRPMRQGAALLAGAIVPMVAQAISALIQVSQPTSPAQFGISQSTASAAGLRISSGVTPIFWVYCVFVIALAISCAWMITEPSQPTVPPSGQPSWPGPIPPVTDTTDDIADSDENSAENSADDGIDDSAAQDDDAKGDEESTYA